MKKSKRTALFVTLAVVVVIIVVYFSFFYPPQSSKNLAGTMIGVEKGKRDIGKQLTVDEIIIENPKMNDFIQSADFQNLIKDENFRKAVMSSDFQDIIIPLMTDFQQYVQLSQDFQQFVTLLNQQTDVKGFLQSDEFHNSVSPEMQKAVLAIPEDEIEAFVAQDIDSKDLFKSVLTSQVQAEDASFSDQFQAVILSQEFQDKLKDLDFSHPELTAIIPEDQMKAFYLIGNDNMDALKAIYNNDMFKAVLFSDDFIKIVHASDFQNDIIVPL